MIMQDEYIDENTLKEPSGRKKAPKPASIHSGHRERVREKYLKTGGLDAFADHEIIEFILYYCIPNGDVNPIAHRLLKEFGSLHNLMDASPQEISRRGGISMKGAILFTLFPVVYSRYESAKWSGKKALDTSRKAAAYLLSLFAGERNERMYLLCLDTQQKLIHAALLSTGTVDETTVYPRLVVAAALKYNASSVIVAHNHPSGNIIPSKGDISSTTTIINALATINVNVLDHIIIGGKDYYSFSEKKLLGMVY